MRYFVAHILSGDAYQYHRTLTERLHRDFAIVPLHTKIEPHVTVKIPFEADEDQIQEVEWVLDSFARAATPVPFHLAGFGRFGFRTVYLDIPQSRAATATVRQCIAALNELPWMQRPSIEGNKLHTSVARFMKHRQFRRVWRHLKGTRPYFKQSLDTFSLLKKNGSQWEVRRTFTFSSPDVLLFSTTSLNKYDSVKKREVYALHH